MLIPEEAKISIVIPALNEEEGIKHVLHKIQSIRIPIKEIIVVDGGSSDKTVEIAKGLGATVITDPRPGYGFAVLSGWKYASGEIIALLDADGTYDPFELPKLVKPILTGEADIVSGMRIHKKPPGMPLGRYLGNIILAILFFILFRKKIYDTQSGYKVLTNKSLRQIKLREMMHNFQLELLLSAFSNNMRIKEVPINYYIRVGKSKNSLRLGILMCLYLVRQFIKNNWSFKKKS